MIELTDAQQNFAGLAVLTVLFLVAACVLIAGNRTMRKRQRFTFLAVCLAIAVITAADWFNIVFTGVAALRVPHTFLTALIFASAPYIPVSIAHAIYPDKATRWVMAALLINVLAELASIFCGAVFWIDEGNNYYRGPLYPLYVAAYVVGNAYLIVQSIRAARTYQASGAWSIMVIVVCMGAGIGIQLVHSNVHITWTAVAMGVVLYFLYYSDIVLRTDALTMLLNRHSYEQFLSNPPLPCAVVSIDVNDFKSVNDTHGHAYGDECLKTVARAIRHTFASSGKCFRTGGDEFLVFMTKGTDDVQARIDELHAALSRARARDGRIPTVSVGHALADADCTDIATVVEAADINMYDRKREGKSA